MQNGLIELVLILVLINALFQIRKIRVYQKDVVRVHNAILRHSHFLAKVSKVLLPAISEEVGKKADQDEVYGRLESAIRKAAIAEKMAERAFNMASSANVGIVILQKSLAVPRPLSRQQGLQNKLAKEGVDKLFTTASSFDWLTPLLSDEELEIIEKAKELNEKYNSMDNKN